MWKTDQKYVLLERPFGSAVMGSIIDLERDFLDANGRVDLVAAILENADDGSEDDKQIDISVYTSAHSDMSDPYLVEDILKGEDLGELKSVFRETGVPEIRIGLTNSLLRYVQVIHDWNGIPGILGLFVKLEVGL